MENLEKYKKEQDLFTQFILLNEEGKVDLSCDSIFSVSPIPNQDIVLWYPFLESIFPSLIALEVGSPEIRFSRVEPEMEQLPGIYDFTFMKVKPDGEERILWGIYDYTLLYEQLRDFQQKRNELEIHRQEMEQNYRALKHQKDILLRKNILLESMQQIQQSYYHRLRNILKSPLNALDMLASVQVDSDQQLHSGQDYLHSLKLTVKQLQALMEEMESIQQLDEIRSESELIPFRIQHSLEDVDKLLHQLGNYNIAVEYFIDTEVPARLLGRPSYLKQILYSLITQAFKHKEQLFVKLKVEMTKNNGNECMIQLRLQQEEQPLDGREFLKVSKEAHAELALHMAVARKLVEIQQGTIYLEEKDPLKGLTIICELPYILSHSA